MKKVLFVLFFSFSINQIYAQAPVQNTQVEERKGIQNPKLARDINELYDMYTNTLKEKNAAIREHGLESMQADKLFHQSKVVDELSRTACVQIIEKYGFPTYDIVGQEVSDKFWQIVLRINSDVALQERVLELMKEALPNNNVSKIGFANLTDRCALNNKKPQHYGTQLYYDEETKSYTHHKIDNLAEMSTRRSEIGLPSMAESIANMNEKYIGDIKSYKDYKSAKENKKATSQKKKSSMEMSPSEFYRMRKNRRL